MTITTVIITALLLGVLIFIHELGHFLAAKAVGIKVHEFSMGLFGPKLYGFRRGETDYTLRLFVFLGGFVRMAGMNPEEPDYNDERGFNRKPVWQRMLVIGAGPFMNFVLALLMFTFIAGALGLPVRGDPAPVIGDVETTGVAVKAGIEPGDRVVSINGQPIASWEQMVARIHGSLGVPLKIELERAGRRWTVEVTPGPNPLDAKKGAIGIMPRYIVERLGLSDSLKYGAIQTVGVTAMWFKSIGGMIRREVPADVVGPVGIARMVGQAARVGAAQVLFLGALLSVTLGIINLLPLPALDGGRLVFLGFEGVRGKPVDPAKENFVHFIGFAILILLALIITYRDIINWFPGVQS